MIFCFFLGAPKAYVDPFGRDIKAKAGEPFKIRIPYKGSPAPTAQWFNVRYHAHYIFVKNSYDL